MNKFQDIQIPDKTLKDSFVNYFKEGDYQRAFNIIADNPQLDTKAFVADCVNDITDILYDIEDATLSNTTEYLDILSFTLNNLINQLIYKREWDVDTVYELYNFVLYNQNIYMYINNTATSGHIPTETNYWINVGLRGEKGAGGCSQLKMKFYWQAGVKYQPYDLVMTAPQSADASGNMWVAKVENTGQTPQDSSAYWERFIEASAAFIYSSQTQPVDNYVGQIWFKIL